MNLPNNSTFPQFVASAIDLSVVSKACAISYLLCFRYLPASPGELCSSAKEKGGNAVRFIIYESDDANHTHCRLQHRINS